MTAVRRGFLLKFKFNKDVDLRAIRWVVTFIAAYWVISELLWNLDFVQKKLVASYTPVLAWELEKALGLLGFDIVRVSSTLFIEGSRLAYKIAPECTGFFGGFLVYLTVVLTLPAPSLLSRLKWLVLGPVVLVPTNVVRLAVVIGLSAHNPGAFDSIHDTSDVLNLVVGCVLAFLAVKHLALAPLGIKMIGSSDSPNPARPEPARPSQG